MSTNEQKSAEHEVNSIALLGRIAELADDGLATDGGHHKQWFLAEILREANASLYNSRKSDGEDLGIAP